MEWILMRRPWVFQAVIIWTTPLPVNASIDRNLMEFVQGAHRASRESIRTYACRAEFTITILSGKSGAPVTQSCSSQYWCSPAKMRAKISERGDEIDFLWDNSIRNCVTRRKIQGQTGAQATRDSYTTRHTQRCDPARLGLLALNVPNTVEHVPFEQLVERATKLEIVERKSVNGKEFIFVQLFFDKSGDATGQTHLEVLWPQRLALLKKSEKI